MLICGTCGPVRLGHEKKGNKTVRICRKCNSVLDK